MPNHSSKPSSKASTPIDSSPARRALLVGAFVLAIAAFSGAFSLIALPFVELPWWKVVRRCVSIAALLSVWLFMRYVHRQPLRSLGLASWAQGRHELRRGLLMGAVGTGVLLLIYLISGQCRLELSPDRVRVWSAVLVNIPAMGLVGVLEELIFRGYVLHQLLGYSKPLAVVLTSAAYALVHLKPNPVWPASAFELTGLFILGVVLALGALRTRQLFWSIGVHAVLAYVARLNKFFLAFSGESVQWVVGTNRLVNGVGAWVAFLGIGWWLMARRGRTAT